MKQRWRTRPPQRLRGRGAEFTVCHRRKHVIAGSRHAARSRAAYCATGQRTWRNRNRIGPDAGPTGESRIVAEDRTPDVDRSPMMTSADDPRLSLAISAEATNRSPRLWIDQIAAPPEPEQVIVRAYLTHEGSPTGQGSGPFTLCRGTLRDWIAWRRTDPFSSAPHAVARRGSAWDPALGSAPGPAFARADRLPGV
jgi:hypothetical protein